MRCCLHDLSESLDDGPRFPGEAGELDVAYDPGSPNRQTDNFGRGDEANAVRCDGNPKTGTDEAENGEPVRCFLDDLGTKAMLFTEREWLFKGALACAAWIVDEGLVAEIGWRNALLLCLGMARRENGDEWLGIDRGRDQANNERLSSNHLSESGAVVQRPFARAGTRPR